MTEGQGEVVLGGVRPWILKAHLRAWGGVEEGGRFRLPGAWVALAELPPYRVGSLSVPRVRVRVEGPEAQAWLDRILLASMRGGG